MYVWEWNVVVVVDGGISRRTRWRPSVFAGPHHLGTDASPEAWVAAFPAVAMPNGDLLGTTRRQHELKVLRAELTDKMGFPYKDDMAHRLTDFA